MQATLTLTGTLEEILAHFKTGAMITVSSAEVEPEPEADEPYIEGSTDIHGLPWDVRIHAANKTKNADGSWRKRRGVDQNLVNQVELELRTPVNTVPQVIVAEPVTNEITFADFMSHIGPKFSSGGPDKIDPEYLKGVCDYILVRTGNALNHIGELMQNPGLIPVAVEKFTVDGKW